jgi:soluble lytic murein transglycosylase
VEDGEEALFIGDTQAAIQAFETALAGGPGPETAERAELGLARAFLLDGASLSAVDTLRVLLDRSPAPETSHQAHFLLAEALVGAGEYTEAVEHYRIFLESGTDSATYVYGWIGEALHAAGDYEGAVVAFQAAVDQSLLLSHEVDLREKMALSYVALQQYDQAVAQYDTILGAAQITGYRARISYQAAETLALAGNLGASYDRHLQVVEEYTTSPWAYSSLVVLVDAGIAVDDLTRGIADYYGGAYDPAVAALYRYVDSSPVHSGSAHYYAGLAHLAAGNPALAASQFSVLVETHPESGYWGSGWMGWAQALTAQGYTGEAVATYREFAELAPEHIRAPEALWTAAKVLEGTGDLEGAAQAYENCQASFPNSDYAAQALIQAGLLYYRVGVVEQAAADWEKLVQEYAGTEYHGAGLMWLGKAYLAAGQPLSATSAFSRAAAITPITYYELRAADLLEDPVAEPFPPSDYTPPTDEEADETSAEEWLANWMGLDLGVDPGELGPSLQNDPRLLAGLELWDLGRSDDGKSLMEEIRRETYHDPSAQYQLALLFRDIGLYRSSILAAARVIALSPAETALDAPPFLGRLAYPTYYEDLVVANAEEEGLPPLMVFSLIRQESLFEGFATSYAYAHGLMQVIPSTGASIAAQLGWPQGYETTDLYRPVVSVRFGSWYLARQRDLFGGRRDVALAAYNGGPGNAGRWVDSVGNDPDLFLEAITLAETRLYLLLIREHYWNYTQLYGHASDLE